MMNTTMTMNAITNKGWHITLWVFQVLLAALFLMVGMMKTFTPIEELAKTAPHMADMPGLIRFIGISELLGGLGLILPAALRIRPALTTLAAAMLGVVMVLATGFHLMRGEMGASMFNIVLLAMTIAVAWGRAKKAVIISR